MDLCPICMVGTECRVKLPCCNKELCTGCLSQWMQTRPGHLSPLGVKGWDDNYHSVPEVIRFSPVRSAPNPGHHYACPLPGCQGVLFADISIGENGRIMADYGRVPFGYARDTPIFDYQLLDQMERTYQSVRSAAKLPETNCVSGSYKMQGRRKLTSSSGKATPRVCKTGKGAKLVRANQPIGKAASKNQKVICKTTGKLKDPPQKRIDNYFRKV